MENLELSNYNVSELSIEETREIIGGSWFDDFKKGFKEGFDFIVEVVGEIKDFVTGKK